ncbi:MAG: 4Fe-4S dicluster domain-containing protein [Planctomycetota bacterium]|jgi:Na+-transporting NADH:ubiquinone oxidoreductase subunit A
MKFRGGFDVFMKGRPSAKVETLPEPTELFLPLQSRTLSFTQVRVEQGQVVQTGQVLAKDEGHYGIPLLAPRGGTVDLERADGHVVLTDLHSDDEEPCPLDDAPHIPGDRGSIGIKRYKLLDLGAWQHVRDARTGRVVYPYGMPTAVIVSTVHLEPFHTRGDAQLRKRLQAFTRGLEHLQTLLEYEPIYLVMPNVRSQLATDVRETLRGYAWAKLVQVPRRYPFHNLHLLSRKLGLKPTEDLPIWTVSTAGVLAFDRALTSSKPCNALVFSLGGPAVTNPVHLKAMPGYPIKDILAGRLADGPSRIIDGGILTGRQIGDDQLGLDSECAGLTVLSEETDRELLSFVRPGWSRRSYSRCFLSAARGRFLESPTTSLRGEHRPCVACGHCMKVCPAGIWPSLIHKALYRDDIDDAQRLRTDLCVECGLCSYVCPSKIDLMEQLIDAKAEIEQERLAEAQAKLEQEQLAEEAAE